MTEPTCRLCNSNLGIAVAFSLEHAPPGAQLFARDHSYAKAVRLEAGQCRYCGLMQLIQPTPVPYYKNAITAAGLSAEMRRFRMRQFSEWCLEFGLQQSRIAELGAATGLLTDLLGECGMVPIGIEHGGSTDPLTSPAQRPLLKGYPVAGEALPGAPFDGFICINFLEHAPNPLEFLRAIADALPPGAPGIVEVPAFEHMLDGKLSYDWIADHLCYFDQTTIRLILELAGFEIVRIERVWHDHDWAVTVRRRILRDLGAMHLDFNQAVGNLRQLILPVAAAGKIVAVWGASHQALTLLTECRFSENQVVAIVDSAPFKQGLIAPGCGLPVVSPVWLADHNVDLVVIMAAGFSQEVATQLRRDMNFSGNAVIYRGSQTPVIVP